jgi:hypothetical protein
MEKKKKAMESSSLFKSHRAQNTGCSPNTYKLNAGVTGSLQICKSTMLAGALD